MYMKQQYVPGIIVVSKVDKQDDQKGRNTPYKEQKTEGGESIFNELIRSRFFSLLCSLEKKILLQNDPIFLT